MDIVEIQDDKKNPETKETPEGGVEVSLEEKKEQEEVQIEEKKPVEDKREEEKKRNAHFAQQRIISKLQEEIAELKEFQKKAPPKKDEISADELDKMVQDGNWKGAMRKVSVAVNVLPGSYAIYL